MRKTSEILRQMIDDCWYNNNGKPYMCVALNDANRYGAITDAECIMTKVWVQGRIEYITTLHSYILETHDYEPSFADTLKWYEDRIKELEAEGL